MNISLDIYRPSQLRLMAAFINQLADEHEAWDGAELPRPTTSIPGTTSGGISGTLPQRDPMILVPSVAEQEQAQQRRRHAVCVCVVCVSPRVLTSSSSLFLSSLMCA